jgi:two-component system, sensor histidine kinase and response regulator
MSDIENPIQVLIVDDVPQNLVAISALLTRPGLAVLQAQSGVEALEALLVEDVAVALLDVQMPQMDGFELAELIRGSERTRHVPLIFLTASASDPGRTFRGYEAGAVDFLYKPIDPMVLRGKVEVFVELHAQRRKLSDQLEELREALRMNEIFAAVLGHDLRNPLGAVINGAELVRRLSDDERVLKAAGLIRSSADRMTRMVEQLLDVARIRSGRIEMKPQEKDLKEVSQALITELDRQGARVELTSTGETRGSFDPDRIAAAISNLVGNAMQHGARESKVRVHIDGSHDESLRLRVSNDGVIPPDVLANIFEPFHASAPTSRSSGGLGLGLYIVHEFVAAHGGTVRARSAQDEGTVFEVGLPRRAEARATAEMHGGRR